MSEIEETLKKITGHEGVEGFVIVNNDGIPIKSNLSNDAKIQYATLITQLTSKARSVVQNLDDNDDLTFLRIRSKKHEILVAPDKEYMLIVIQSFKS